MSGQDIPSENMGRDFRGGRSSRSTGGRGRGRGGKGGHGGRSSSSNGPEMKFYPHGSGKGQSVTYATVKDHIINYVQRTYRHGKDVALSLRNLEKEDLSTIRPQRMVSTNDDVTVKAVEQAGLDIDYQEEMKQFLDRKRALDENLDKAYALIFGTYCSKSIQSRVEEHPEFETKIRDNPIELLTTISVLMHDTVRARYPYASMNEALLRLINMKQQEHEHLTEYVKRFKQARDVVKSHMGSEWLHEFVEHTDEYNNESDTTVKDQLKKASFERWHFYCCATVIQPNTKVCLMG